MTTGARPLAALEGWVDGLAPDRAVPTRSDLLDPTVVAGAFAQRLGLVGRLDVVGCELLRTKYRVGESLRVVYRVHLADGGTAVVAGRTIDPAAATSGLARATRDAVPSAGLRPVWHDPILAVLWWTYPNDRYLRGLVELQRPDESVAGLLPGTGTWTTSELVGLAPGRSAVLRALDGTGSTLAYAKVYAPGTTSLSSLAGLYNAVAGRLGVESGAVARAGGGAISPRALAYDAGRNLLLLEPVAGTSWVGQPVAAVERAMTKLGASIAVLHSMTPPPGVTLRRFSRLESKHLPRAADVVGTARPDAAPAVNRLVARLLATQPVPSAGGAPVVLHGDCHPGNLLCGEREVALIDLDQAGLGPAAADVASLIARLRQGEVVGEVSAAAANAMIAAFCAGYAEIRPLPHRPVLAWNVAVALLVERVLRAVNRVHPRVLPRIPDLLELAHLALSDGVPV